MTVYVSKLSLDTRKADLKSAFEDFGTVESVKIIMDKDTGLSKGFGFVEMPNDDDAYAAINDLNDSDMDGRTISVSKAMPREHNVPDVRPPGMPDHVWNAINNR